jgi:adenylate cyclase
MAGGLLKRVLKEKNEGVAGGAGQKKNTTVEFLQQLGLSVVLGATVVLFTQDSLLGLAPLKRLELSTIDYRFALRGPVPTEPESLGVVILEISQESFTSLPEKWPWPATYYARVIRNLERAGAAAVGIDIVFSEPDKHGKESEEVFRQAIRETKICVLAGKLEVASDLYTVKRANENYNNVYFDVDSSIGVVNVVQDDDGVLRRYVPFWYHRGTERLLPTLAFGSLNKVFGKHPFHVPENTPAAFLYEGRVIPKADKISMLINYYGADRTFPHFKFADVMDDEEFTTVEEEELGESINTFDDPDFGYLYSDAFRGKVVLVGSTMPEDKDLFPVAFSKGGQAGDNLMYGVEVHANALQNVLDSNFLTPESEWLEILTVMIGCVLVFFATTKVKEIKFRVQVLGDLLGVVIVAIGLTVLLTTSFLLFKYSNYVTAITGPSIAIVMGFVGATAYNFITERKQKVLIKGMFGQYVNPAFVEELVAHPEKLRLGGERKELTVLFSDVAGFTTISESLQPEDLVTLLNEYLSEMTDIIFATGGTLDKYEGDAIMAFWGAPIPQEDHAIRACTASLQMQEALVGIRERWKKEGKPNIHVRIGLSTGDMVVGNMGGRGKFDYTVMGDTVNLGSRLEGANKEYGTYIMISQKTYERVKEKVVARQLDLLVVKGKTEPIAVYELIGFAEDGVVSRYSDFLKHYNEGLQLYRRREWGAAIHSFEKALGIRADDGPSKMYIERAKTYKASPPPPEWNGVFILKTK